MSKHKHAENMMAYAQDAMETVTPWERWEYYGGMKDLWHPVRGHPRWSELTQYRRKPRTININGFDVPEPVREPLKYGVAYYIPDIGGYPSKYGSFLWSGDIYNTICLNRGMIHLTQEAAEIHARAILSFTETNQ